MLRYILRSNWPTGKENYDRFRMCTWVWKTVKWRWLYHCEPELSRKDLQWRDGSQVVTDHGLCFGCITESREQCRNEYDSKQEIDNRNKSVYSSG